jgi:lysyl-tRNA synthetase class 2
MLIFVGRITSPRVFGKKLIFLNLTTSASYSSHLVGAPVKLEARNIFGDDESLTGQPDSLKVWLRTVQRGDWIGKCLVKARFIARAHHTSAVTGKFATNQEGALSIIATELPTTLAPTLQPIPEDITDAEFRMHNRHADMIVHPRERDVIFIRQRILQSLRAFLNGNRFIEVNTPILQAGAGGAVARPFETTATEFSDLKLNLRVAPELFLKRLIIGGMPRVFEIGSAFRNEGLDATHNPEFTTCEFYSVMASLDNLMTLTETLFNRFAATAKQARGSMKMLPDLDHLFDSDTFARLEFIPTIEGAIRERSPEWTFPDLTSRDAQEKLFAVFDEFKVTKPASTNLPRLLDALAGHFIEPLCTKPTFITHHPECMSPLAKSFDAEPMTTSSISHRVSARAELFIESREYVNCYEEENSPLQQRRKFEDQLAYRAEDDGETSRGVDESYVGALEWGMPPTGGWGCGIDRIVMLFTGKSRIADVLPFGNLRNVVGLGNKEVKKNKVGISDEAKMLQETRRELEEAQTLLAELRQEVKDLREDALEGSG